MSSGGIAPLHLTLTIIVAGLLFGVRCVDLGQSTTTSSSGFAEQQLQCQAAAAHLGDCCPDIQATLMELTCDYSTTMDGCGLEGDSRTSPTLSSTESQCILDEDCATMVGAGVCARVERRVEEGPTTAYEDAESPPNPVVDGSAPADAGAAADASVCP